MLKLHVPTKTEIPFTIFSLGGIHMQICAVNKTSNKISCACKSRHDLLSKPKLVCQGLLLPANVVGNAALKQRSFSMLVLQSLTGEASMLRH